MENIVKNRTIPSFVFQGTVLISVLALILLRGQNLGTLVTNPALGLKFVLLLLIAGLLIDMHISLQPRIDALFAEAGYQIAPRSYALAFGWSSFFGCLIILSIKPAHNSPA